MELSHTFTVPVDVGRAWAAFQDIAGVAECFPGAAVTSVDGDRFDGTCKVKLGPVALQYAGSGTFVERDESARRMVLEAKGRDKRGNGTAGALVTAAFAEVAPSSTRVEVTTDLQITGKPAQFGRGVMQDVSDKLLGQFVACLEERMAPTESSAAAPDTASDPGPATEPEAATSPVASPVTSPVTSPAPPLGGGSGEPSRPSQDAIDLGSTVLPVLARTYGPWLAAVVVLLLLVRYLGRRRR